MAPELVELKNLHISASDETPTVLLTLDSNESHISGRSLPENAFDFYEPILDWIKAYVNGVNAPFSLTLKFEYFNSSSGRYLFELLHILEQSRFREQHQIIWVTEKDDELMIDKGHELKSLCDLAFEMKFI